MFLPSDYSVGDVYYTYVKGADHPTFYKVSSLKSTSMLVTPINFIIEVTKAKSSYVPIPEQKTGRWRSAKYCAGLGYCCVGHLRLYKFNPEKPMYGMLYPDC